MNKHSPVFEVLEHTRTGLSFTNKLTPTNTINMLKYMYFYNGAGVGAGDFNNDGLIDLFLQPISSPINYSLIKATYSLEIFLPRPISPAIQPGVPAFP
ncbi:VCBS repeat-containing protein [Paraflavitalea speifideaquila]|uniref:FG-GAP repeat domain-containing protein n=1 Tax=Paraflavitalea speifideaquila TaxID=3076558 RepID=UPI0028F0E5B3|nr:VCBS repeat-containing protein [Paraflavitalea speifideiaquila]